MEALREQQRSSMADRSRLAILGDYVSARGQSGLAGVLLRDGASARAGISCGFRPPPFRRALGGPWGAAGAGRAAGQDLCPEITMKGGIGRRRDSLAGRRGRPPEPRALLFPSLQPTPRRHAAARELAPACPRAPRASCAASTRRPRQRGADRAHAAAPLSQFSPSTLFLRPPCWRALWCAPFLLSSRNVRDASQRAGAIYPRSLDPPPPSRPSATRTSRLHPGRRFCGPSTQHAPAHAMFVLSVHSTIGPGLLGALLGAVSVDLSLPSRGSNFVLMALLHCLLRLYGVMCLQVSIYFRTYPGDRLLLKATVRLSLGAYIAEN